MVGDLSAPAWIAIVLAVVVGATVQTTVGFGLGMIAAPVLALLLREALPVTMLLLATPLTAATALRERGHIDAEGLRWLIGGRVVGTGVGVALLIVVPDDSLEVLFGAMIVGAVALSAGRPAAALRRRNRLTAGTLSGVMGTTTSVGGPPLALLYRGRPGAEIRSTLAVSLFMGLLISLAGLAVADQVRAWQALLALALLPALALGVALGIALSRWADRAWLRPAVLAFSAAGGAAAILRGVV